VSIVEDESATSWPERASRKAWWVLAGHFLIDRDGILRWGQTEAGERIGDLTKFPSVEEILRAARAL
jgi:hypothetical protein